MPKGSPGKPAGAAKAARKSAGTAKKAGGLAGLFGKKVIGKAPAKAAKATANKPTPPVRVKAAGGPGKAVAYYYAGGRKVPLTPATDLLAIDEDSLAAAGIAPAIRDAVCKASRPLLRGIRLVSRADLKGAGDVVGVLERAGVVHPVYRARQAIVVALPQVRVEETRGAKKQALEKWIASNAGTVEVESHGDERIVLRPRSGYGGDALAIANELAERVKPEMAQPEFLRLTAAPTTFGGPV